MFDGGRSRIEVGGSVLRMLDGGEYALLGAVEAPLALSFLVRIGGTSWLVCESRDEDQSGVSDATPKQGSDDGFSGPDVALLWKSKWRAWMQSR